jgi:competence protein ComEC
LNDSSPTEAVDEASTPNAASRTPVPDSTVLDDQPRSLNSFGRFPAAPIVLGMASGVLFDRYGSWSPNVLLGGFVAACLIWAVSQTLRRLRLAAVSVVAISAFIGAIYHHHVWHSLPSEDIAPLLSLQPTLIRCEGVVASAPVVTPPRENPFNSRLPPESSTKFQLAVESLDATAGRREVSGRLQIVINGIMDGVKKGDHVDVQGWSQANRPLMNPGGFDRAAYSRGKGLRGIVRVRDPALINVTVSGASMLERLRRTLRNRAEAVLESAIPEDVRPVADAMLLGDRSMLPREMRTVFVESGTVHLLAISGLHIGILMMFLLAIGRAMRLSSKHAILLALAVLFIYLQVADCRPPMIRAFVIIAIWSVGRLVRRPAFSANSLAIAAIVILGMNPTSLFDVGSQLSFLAVAVIFWLTSLGRLSNGEPDVAAVSDANNKTVGSPASIPEVLQRPWVRSLKAFGKTVGALWLVSGSIWLISAPLVVSVFNVVSPVGLMINVLLIPVVGVGLCFGFASILLGVISQTIAWPFAFVFGWFLKWLVATVDLAASIDPGHAYVPEPPGWWLIVFYSAVATAMLATTLKRRPARVWCGVGVWAIFGLTLLPANREEGSLRCTALSVGHGLSVIVETPSGKTLVYDVGSRAGGEFSSRVLKEALWARGISKVDALIVSHSDIDHYNGVLDLLESVPVGRILCSRHFPDSRQQLTLKTFEAAAELGVRATTISQGDSLSLDDAVSMRILQPFAATSYNSDNAASIVLELEYQQRRILLTGDLDEDGLDELLKQPARKVDVLMAPHHGAPSANSLELASWASPTFAIASAPTPAYQKYLESNYGPKTRVVMTSESGAVTATVTSKGVLSVEPFLDGRDQNSTK